MSAWVIGVHPEPWQVWAWVFAFPVAVVLAEGANLYFTNARADARITAYVATLAGLTDAADDAAAATAGVPVGAQYRTGSTLKVRIT